MRKTIVKVLILTAICILSFAGCDSQKGVADNSASVNPTTEATSTVENNSTAKPTETKKEPTEDPTTTTEPTKAPSVTTSETTVKPIVTDSPTKTPATSTTEPTKAPTTTEPTKVPSVTTSEPTKAPATSTTEPTKAPTTTEPTKGPTVTIDPTKDYSEWGNYGFESLLPAPLPFNTEWLSSNYAGNSYDIMSANPFKISDAEKNIKILEDYVKSLEAYGYTFMPESYSFLAFNEYGTTFEFSYRDHYVCVSFTLVA